MILQYGILKYILMYTVFALYKRFDMDYVYRFPVVKGNQANHEYYIAMVPLKMISRLFPDDEEYVSPEYRAQRKLNEARVPVISKYILDNRESYVFSALAASIDGAFQFVPMSEGDDIGTLEVSMDARFLINDGQHRKAAILDALKEDQSLGDETISIVFYEDQGLERSQQIFTDLNKNAVKTSNSISELYDSRDQMAVITRRVIQNVEFLNLYTDKEKDILGKYSSKLFTLNTFYMANKTIIGRFGVDVSTEKFIEQFWKCVADNMVLWNELQAKSITKVDLRENYIATQGIVIRALGRIGNFLNTHQDYNMQDVMRGIRDINWSRNASIWRLRAISSNGRVITNNKAAILIGNVIKTKLGLPLSQAETNAEQEYLDTINKN